MKKIILLVMLLLTMMISDEYTITSDRQLIVSKTITEETVPYTVVPNLYGFGTDTKAAYGGSVPPIVLHVTKLTGTDEGSFWWAVKQEYPRIVVFDVSGVIHGDNTTQCIVRSPYLTVAGQTAPGPVVMDQTYIVFQTHDVLLQHIGFTGSTMTDGVSLSVNTANGNAVYNFVVDHCLICWGIDDNNDFWANTTGSLYNVTIANTIYAEGLASGAADESKGLLVLGDNIDITNNLFHSNIVRNPYLSIHGDGKVSSYALWNNIIHNYVNRQTMLATASVGVANGTIKLSYVGNESIAGPSTKPSYVPGKYMVHTDFYDNADNNTLLIHMEDNIKYTGAITGVDIWNGDKGKANTGYTLDNNPVTVPNHIPYAANETKATVLENVGPRPASRGALETRFIDEVTNGTGSVKELRPAMPSYTETTKAFVPVVNPHGMYNEHYTNLEHQIHQLAAAVETLQ